MAMPYFAPTLSQGIFPNRIIRSSEIRPCACCWSNKSRHLLPCHRTIEMVSVSRKHLFIFFPSSFLFRYRRCSDGRMTLIESHDAPIFLLHSKVQIRPEIQGKRGKSQSPDMDGGKCDLLFASFPNTSQTWKSPSPPPPHRLPYSLP
jgi:hypothetical protein